MGVDISLYSQVVGLRHGTLRDTLTLARMADEAGLRSIYFGDHLVIGQRTDRYPYGDFQAYATKHLESPWLEPITTLAAISAVTSRIRLATNVMLVPLRPAALLAKSIATLDVLSQGRTELGFGVGWQREEFEASRIDWALRNRLFYDNIAACRALWGEQPVTFSSETLSFENLTSYPRPHQERIPLLYGVRMTGANARHAATFGDGWCPHGLSPEEIREGLDRLRAAFEQVGRDPSTIIVRARPEHILCSDGRIDIDKTLQSATGLVAAGVQILGFGPLQGFESLAEIEPYLHTLAQRAREFGA